METKEQNLFQAFFRSELTWLGTIIVAIWGFVVTVVIPINNLQLQMAIIQTQLKTQITSYTALGTQINDIATKQQVDEQVMDNFGSELSRVFPSVTK